MTNPTNQNENTQKAPKTLTPIQQAFIDAVKGKKIPLIDNFLTINNYFDIYEDSGEFSHIDTHAAFLLFHAGYIAGGHGVFHGLLNELNKQAENSDNIDLGK